MISNEENQLMCRVENDAPMGQLMRRHWIPICLQEEVSDADGTPVKARILGEDLVVFRDSDGQVGVLDEYCPHRRASLVFARNEEGGLRCLYHGWKMDVKGNVTEMSSEPEASGMLDKVKIKAYPTKEWGGFVWAYMGPKESIPEFLPPRWAPTADARVSVAKVVMPVNWAQILEGAIDSAHSSSLHSSDMVPARVHGAEATDKNWLRPSTDKAPRMQVQRTSYGFRYAAIRRPIFNAETHDYVRSTVFVAPFTVLIPPNNLYNVANVNVPMDDTNTCFYFIGWGKPDQVPETATWRKFLGQTVGQDLDSNFRPLRNYENRYWQDRQAMKNGNFSGITGIPNQDMAMWLTMGAIADRSHDRLGASDMAIVEFRKQMIEAAQAFKDTGSAIGTGEMTVPASVCSFQGVIPKTIDWRSFDTKYVWEKEKAAAEQDNEYKGGGVRVNRNLQISVAMGDYDRNRALYDGRVQIDGCDPVYMLLNPEEMFFRAMRSEDFDVTELSFSSYLVKHSRGDCPYIGIPVFLSRAFRHTSIYVRKDRIKKPEDLKGRKIGVPEYQLTANVWARSILQDDYGVSPEDVTWVRGGIDTPGRPEKIKLELPDGVKIESAPEGKTISEMLNEGDIDGFIAPRPPSARFLSNPNIGWLFDDPTKVAKDYYRRTGIFPIMHVLGIRKELAAKNRWLPGALFKAFSESKSQALELLSDTSATKVTLPFVEEQLKAAKETLGEDYWSYGVGENRKTLEAFLHHHYAQGLSQRKLSIEELFDPSTYESYSI